MHKPLNISRDCVECHFKFTSQNSSYRIAKPNSHFKVYLNCLFTAEKKSDYCEQCDCVLHKVTLVAATNLMATNLTKPSALASGHTCHPVVLAYRVPTCRPVPAYSPSNGQTSVYIWHIIELVFCSPLCRSLFWLSFC